MSERPTVEEIIGRWDYATDYEVPQWVMDQARNLVEVLRSHGYRIVHPDDVPLDTDQPGSTWEDGLIAGWNDCRAHIFGEGA